MPKHQNQITKRENTNKLLFLDVTTVYMLIPALNKILTKLTQSLKQPLSHLEIILAPKIFS